MFSFENRMTVVDGSNDVQLPRVPYLLPSARLGLFSSTRASRVFKPPRTASKSVDLLESLK